MKKKYGPEFKCTAVQDYHDHYLRIFGLFLVITFSRSRQQQYSQYQKVPNSPENLLMITSKLPETSHLRFRPRKTISVSFRMISKLILFIYYDLSRYKIPELNLMIVFSRFLFHESELIELICQRTFLVATNIISQGLLTFTDCPKQIVVGQ